MKYSTNLTVVLHYFSGGHIHFEALCVIEGLFRFLQDAWFIFAVFILILGDEELGHNFPGKDMMLQSFNWIREKLAKNASNNSVTATYFNGHDSQIE